MVGEQSAIDILVRANGLTGQRYAMTGQGTNVPSGLLPSSVLGYAPAAFNFMGGSRRKSTRSQSLWGFGVTVVIILAQLFGLDAISWVLNQIRGDNRHIASPVLSLVFSIPAATLGDSGCMRLMGALATVYSVFVLSFGLAGWFLYPCPVISLLGLLYSLWRFYKGSLGLRDINPGSIPSLGRSSSGGAFTSHQLCSDQGGVRCLFAAVSGLLNSCLHSVESRVTREGGMVLYLRISDEAPVTRREFIARLSMAAPTVPDWKFFKGEAGPGWRRTITIRLPGQWDAGHLILGIIDLAKALGLPTSPGRFKRCPRLSGLPVGYPTRALDECPWAYDNFVADIGGSLLIYRPGQGHVETNLDQSLILFGGCVARNSYTVSPAFPSREFEGDFVLAGRGKVSVGTWEKLFSFIGFWSTLSVSALARSGKLPVPMRIFFWSNLVGEVLSTLAVWSWLGDNVLTALGSLLDPVHGVLVWGGAEKALGLLVLLAEGLSALIGFCLAVTWHCHISGDWGAISVILPALAALKFVIAGRYSRLTLFLFYAGEMVVECIVLAFFAGQGTLISIGLCFAILESLELSLVGMAVVVAAWLEEAVPSVDEPSLVLSAVGEVIRRGWLDALNVSGVRLTGKGLEFPFEFQGHIGGTGPLTLAGPSGALGGGFAHCSEASGSPGMVLALSAGDTWDARDSCTISGCQGSPVAACVRRGARIVPVFERFVVAEDMPLRRF